MPHEVCYLLGRGALEKWNLKTGGSIKLFLFCIGFKWFLKTFLFHMLQVAGVWAKQIQHLVLRDVYFLHFRFLFRRSLMMMVFWPFMNIHIKVWLHLYQKEYSIKNTSAFLLHCGTWARSELRDSSRTPIQIAQFTSVKPNSLGMRATPLQVGIITLANG